MAYGSAVSGVLFVVGLGAIAISGGAVMYMLAGDVLIALPDYPLQSSPSNLDSINPFYFYIIKAGEAKPALPEIPAF